MSGQSDPISTEDEQLAAGQDADDGSETAGVDAIDRAAVAEEQGHQATHPDDEPVQVTAPDPAQEPD
jgi:hypothetical protein